MPPPHGVGVIGGIRAATIALASLRTCAAIAAASPDVGQRLPALASIFAHALSNFASQRDRSGAAAPSFSASTVAFSTHSSYVPARIILPVLQVTAGSAASAAAAPSARTPVARAVRPRRSSPVRIRRYAAGG